MKVDIVDNETGEVYGTVSTKYKRVETLFENAGRWCRRHGFTGAGFEAKEGKLTAIYVSRK